MRLIVLAGLVVGGLVHLLPLAGVLGPAKLRALYDVEVNDPALVLLLRHRAVLFGILGVLMLAATRVTALQWPALLAGMASAVAFVVLARAAGIGGGALGRVVTVDWIAIGFMGVAMVGLALEPVRGEG